MRASASFAAMQDGAEQRIGGVTALQHSVLAAAAALVFSAIGDCNIWVHMQFATKFVCCDAMRTMVREVQVLCLCCWRACSASRSSAYVAAACNR